MQRFIFILLCFLWALSLDAQQPAGSAATTEIVPERLLLRTDRQLYISGETIWFKLMAFQGEDARISTFSEVAYLELIDPGATPITRVKLDMENGSGSGSIELPGGLSSGTYTVRAYTQEMRNGRESDFCKAHLIILNPRQPVAKADPEDPEAYRQFEPTSPRWNVGPDRYLDIQLLTEQQEFDQRTPVSLKITTVDAAGRPVPAELSLSVALSAGSDNRDRSLFKKHTSGPSWTTAVPQKRAFEPEDRGMLVKGTVYNESTQSGAPGVDVYLAFPGSTALVYVDVTDEAGGFSFLLPKMYGLRQIVLQTRTEQEMPLRIELAEEFHAIPAAQADVFVLPPDWIPQANASLANAQIRQSYQSFELPPVYKPEEPYADIPFYGSPEALYRLDDYNRFPLPEFFYEIVNEVMVRGKYGNERVAVFNEWGAPFQDLPPLLLVDGVPVFDQRTFLKINNKLIESAAIVTEPFWLNPRFYNGIINLISFDKDGRCFRLPESALQRSLLTLLPEREFPLSDYEAQKDNRLPDFRNTLYWNPSIQTDANGEATVQFFTSDTIGAFEVRVEGIAENGLLGSGHTTFRVVKTVK